MTFPSQGFNPDPRAVNEFHRYDDTDGSENSHHHTLGIEPTQAAFGDHTHDGTNSKLLSKYVAKATVPPVVSGSRGGNAALANLLTTLDAAGIIDDQTTA